MFDAVLSVHASPDGCGVTKFNQQLAKGLGVVHDRLVLRPHPHWKYPLLSLKNSELSDSPDVRPLLRQYPKPYAVFWHDAGDQVITTRAAQVWYASEVGCPSTIRGDATRPGQTVLTFGMGHKTGYAQHRRLKMLLDASGAPYVVCQSSAVHEGHPWDQTTTETAAQMRAIYGDAFRWLGYLADDALAREIRDAHLIALFYEPAARANNTTLWAALEAGTPVITNLDAHSPKELAHQRSVFDLDRLLELPDASERREARFGGWQAAKAYGWDRVLSALKVNLHA